MAFPGQLPAARARDVVTAVTLAAAFVTALVLGACLRDLPERAFGTDGGGVSPCGDGLIEPAAGEDCDPGDGRPSERGCLRCTVDCEDGGVRDPTSNHCYFLGAPTADLAAAEGACRSLGAHVVTLGSDEERRALLEMGLLGPLGETGRFWIGLRATSGGPDGGVPSFASVAGGEPGWAPSSRCPGCYDLGPAGPGSGPSAGLLPWPSSPPAGQLCATAGASPTAPTVNTYPCDVRGTEGVPTPSVVCEREPLGSRARYCNGPLCVQVVRTIASRKRYLYVATAVRSDEAVAACDGLGGRLVVLDTREEREQLVLELTRAGVLSAKPAFWIGLRRSSPGPAGPSERCGGDGGPPVFRWEDCAPEGVLRPSVWGDGEPKAKGPARAYLSVGGGYDSQLAHAEDFDDGVELPFVCEGRE